MPADVKQLQQGLSVVGALVDGVSANQWSAPTPCTEWTVRDLVNHLVGVNMVFSVLLRDQNPPERGTDLLGEDPSGAYASSAEELVAAFDQPGLLEQVFSGPLGDATGAERLHIRIVDLLAHGWDLAQATGQALDFPADVVEQALGIVRGLDTMPRSGRFAPAQPVCDDAPPLDRLVALLGRFRSWSPV